MHNYLFYEGGLESYLSSNGCSIAIHKQGDGAVNNLAAMRNSPLREQGLLKTVDGKKYSNAFDNIVVFNNDMATPSPVLHQFDRDNELKGVVKKRTSALLSKWNTRTK